MISEVIGETFFLIRFWCQGKTQFGNGLVFSKQNMFSLFSRHRGANTVGRISAGWCFFNESTHKLRRTRHCWLWHKLVYLPFLSICLVLSVYLFCCTHMVSKMNGLWLLPLERTFGRQNPSGESCLTLVATGKTGWRRGWFPTGRFPVSSLKICIKSFFFVINARLVSECFLLYSYCQIQLAVVLSKRKKKLITFWDIQIYTSIDGKKFDLRVTFVTSSRKNSIEIQVENKKEERSKGHDRRTSARRGKAVK